MLQEEARDSSSPIALCGQKCQFRAVGALGILEGIAPAAYQRLAVAGLRGNDESDNAAEIDLGQLFELGVRQRLLGAEEAPVNCLAIQALESLEHARGILSPNGAHRDLRAVLQHVVG